MLSHKPLIRLQKCGIFLSLLFQMKKNQYFPIISSGVLNSLCHISFHHLRKSRGIGSGKYIVREDEVFLAVHTHASCPLGIVHSKIRSFIHSQVPEMSTDIHSIPGTVPGMGNSGIKTKPNNDHFWGRGCRGRQATTTLTRKRSDRNCAEDKK